MKLSKHIGLKAVAVLGVIVVGSAVFLQAIDSGTEPKAQAAPDTGVEQNGVVEVHPGFLSAASGGILADPRFLNADFTRPGYPIAQIRVQAVPLPPAALLIISGLFGGLSFARWKKREPVAA